MTVRPETICLLDADPDLAEGLEGRELELARHESRVAVYELQAPTWNPGRLRDTDKPGWLGLYVLDGLMLRVVVVGRRNAAELFGPGDVFRPWDADGEYAPLPISLRWRILRPVRLAVLDQAFTRRIAPWPAITSRIAGRMAHRARYLALNQAATHLPRVHARVLILFWLLAERWGTVAPDGVRIDLPLTHELLAMLTGARRPSVTVALQRLERAGLLVRRRRDRWLLTTLAMERLADPESLSMLGDGPEAEHDSENGSGTGHGPGDELELDPELEPLQGLG